MSISTITQIDAALSAARQRTKLEIEQKLKLGLSIATIEDGQLVSCHIVETVISESVKSRKSKTISLPENRHEDAAGFASTQVSA